MHFEIKNYFVIKFAISLSNATRYEFLQTQLMKDLSPCISEKITHACEKLAHWTAL